MSAYDKGGNIRKKQLEMLKVFMKEEKEKSAEHQGEHEQPKPSKL